MSLKNKKVLVTGAAGFIGAALVNELFREKANVIGIDNLNNYYSKDLKISRLSRIEKNKQNSRSNWNFYKTSLEDLVSLKEICSKNDLDIIVHLAAQAGVRYSLENPKAYIDSNLVGFGNILEICRIKKIQNFIFASSSSVYGMNKKIPFCENDNVDYPVSFYAATKKANEVMAHSYSHLYGIPTTGLRFFTVYGPYGRPDMAPMIFANAILKGQPIKIFNNGKMERDFTYISDIVEGIIECCKKPASSIIQNDPEKNEQTFSNAPYRLFNIGNNRPIKLNYFVDLLEKYLECKAIRNFMPMQPGDVKLTYANTSELEKWIGYKPSTSIEDGLQIFTNWYKNHYG